MSARLDVLGILVFVALVLGLGALVAMPRPPEDDGHRAMLTYRVDATAPVEFVIPTGSARVKLVTVAEAPPTPDPLHEPAYTVRLAWIDDGDAVIGERALVLRSRPSDLPGAAPGPDGLALLAPRSTVVDVPAHDRPIVGLRIAVPEGGQAVRIRAFRDRPAALATPELDLLRVDERDAKLLARQIGVERWADVTVEEALALVALRWEAISPRRGSLPDGARVVSRVADPPVSGFARRAAGTTLLPGRALAFPVIAPAELLLVGDGDTTALRLLAITEDVGVVAVRADPAPSPPWRPGATALRVRIEGPGDTTLHVANDGPLPVGALVALLDAGALDRVPEDAEAAPASAFTDVGDADALSVPPGTTELSREASVGGARASFPLPTLARRAVLRLELRPVDARGDVAVDLVVRRAEGPARTLRTQVTWLPSPYEVAAPRGEPLDPARVVGDPVERYLALGPGDTSLEVHPIDGTTVLVSAALSGPELGRREAWDRQRRTRVRYARDVRTPWATLAVPPVAPWVVSAQRRRELLSPDEGGDPGTERPWRLVEPVALRDGLPGEPWLFPVDEGASHAGLAWCRLLPGRDERFRWSEAAAAELGGELAAAVWAPGVERDPRLGGSVELLLDDRAWTRAGLVAPVLRHVARHVPADRARLEGPPGAVAWLRTLDRTGLPCDEPWQAKRTIPVGPSAVARFVVDKDRPSQLLLLGGTAPGPVDLVVEIGAAVPGDDVVLTDWTLRERLFHVEPLPERAIALDTPWRSDPVLDPFALRLQPDVAGRVEVRVRAVGASTARVFALLEGEPSLARTAVEPHRVRR